MFKRLELDPAAVVFVNNWQYAGSGYDNDAERELAAYIAERVRAQRLRKYVQEGDNAMSERVTDAHSQA
ncbi:hypothetical protein SAMN04488564_1011012 [Lentzea waywayandensis]|uniref:Uncharacterized protein n=1 Tax=Lentzea waywayandensis TaxID=84724 RepID=A0A1I6D3Z7_9PSEU|nr:hypothetical protein SAMN04488564_1011012 [Lentzea waywayandensis]